ncbi:carboxy-S-adenosyl-L-methionine synthase CmoA [Candidatus Erwinia haradaeae]|uniref:Carboxy-S-adenosyl-L-methionine synthase n=1 Tax=Candidatus Erwinia haradaeae TaxID=1922217 RepID=A0A803FU40_9GAMM|nr:carboxy-S-adenosyl-L-methionine synthase CmoA [Candidatus Erwinia haradaeae]VFP88467.1 Carboxy-S-adenosyl-L-methionine synthase [Candidatus Erwinia haradaeae]
MYKRDTLFALPLEKLGDWKFDKEIVEVFPDMIERSIPGYSDLISMIGILSRHCVQNNSLIYDLGCSLGAATLSVKKNIQAIGCKIIAVDNSPYMVDRCRHHINIVNCNTPVEIIMMDICKVSIHNASLVLLNFTLQFIPIEDRQRLLDSIWRGMNLKGVLVLSEKLSFSDKEIEALLLKTHYDFKRDNGYSALEIQQKNRMLNKVMITENLETHKKRLDIAGFEHHNLWFQSINFGSLLALKSNIN